MIELPYSKAKRYLVEPIYNFVFPPLCLFCKKELQRGRRIICPDCFNNLDYLSPILVESLKEEIPNPYFTELFILYPFNAEFQQLVHLLKYQRYLTIAKYFARELAQKVYSNDYDLITAVPLHKVRERERGYNQSDLIGKELGLAIDVEFDKKILKRNRNTVTQTKLSRKERNENVKGVFTCKTDVQNKKILLIDDVVTTGSTLNACAAELKKSGAIKIDTAVIATPLDFLQYNLEKQTDQLDIF